METLNFRTVYVSKDEFANDDELKTHICQYMEELKQNMKKCGLIEVNINLLKEKSDEADYHEIYELIFHVQATHTAIDVLWNKSDCYNDFLKKWKELFSPEPSPIITLYENSTFVASDRACHIANPYTDVSFGVLPYTGEFHVYESFPSSGYADFFHDTRHMNIKYNNFELMLSYNSIRNIFVNIDSSPREIFFDLCNPPLVFRVERKRKRDDSEYTYIKYRTMSLKNLVDLDVFGRSNVMRVSLSDTETVSDIVSKLHFQCCEKPVHFAHIVSVLKTKPVHTEVKFPHFGCTYLLTAILRRNFTMASQVDDAAGKVKLLKTFSKENPTALEKALILVLAAVDAGKMVNYWREIDTKYQYYSKNKVEDNYAKYVVPEHCRMIRRIILTPTRQMLFAPEIMFSNRILRNFDPDYALRVSFRDDNNSRLSFHAFYADEEVFDLAVRRPMERGIEIGTRCYNFLAWSNSQIREHGIWMYAEDMKLNTAQGMRLWMGKFSHIHSVSKHMARMGQCFSQTEEVSVRLDQDRVRTEDDIEHGVDVANNFRPYCFSDGVGRISTKLANEVHEFLGHDKACSAFQIRYGGYKGMLVVDPTLKDVDIVFRKSMKKFDSPHSTRLEIAKTSAPINLHLNRPFITILNGMGVRHRTFLRLQENALKDFIDILFEESKAAKFLDSRTPNELFGYNELSRSGIYLTTEPFFRRLLLAVHRLNMGKIKTKANIPIDPSEGRNMLGVVDETGLLNEGQVFVQYTRNISCGETTRDTDIVERTVLVTKNPCHLPGDVRKFQAVNLPQLHHIVDCIVFPQKGSRPHSNEMAGSDMDGDEYAVLWNDDLIFHRENAAPGHFPSAPEKYLQSITEKDMIDFFIRYIKNDQVGSIANAHLAHADDSGIFSEECLTIAKKFSIAVDFAKSGVSEHLEPHERPERYPDFMERYHKETYKSKKALGYLYRVAQDYLSENESARMTYQDIQVDEDLRFPGWEKYKEDAIRSRDKFNALLKMIFRNYGIQHEAEVYSGSFTNLHNRFQERRDRDEVERVVVRCIKRLIKSFKEEFFTEFKSSSEVKEADVQVFQKASAWYVVTYSDKNAEFLSFPWTVFKFLATIKLKRIDTILPLHISPIVQKMNQQIQVCDSKSRLPPLSLEAESEFQKYSFVSDPEAVKLALRTLMLWAKDEDILKKSEEEDTGWFMYDITFVDLFFHVAESLMYAVKKGQSFPPAKVKDVTSAALCLDFLRFCTALRYYNDFEIMSVIPFHVYKYKTLSKRAVIAYHTFAVMGKFSNLYLDPVGAGQMRQVQIESSTFPCVPIDPDLLENARQVLMRLSEAEDVTLREILLTKKVAVNAVGSEKALETLKSVLGRKSDDLRKLFMTGCLEEEEEHLFLECVKFR